MDSFLHKELFRCLDRAAGYFGLTSPGTFSFGPFLMFYLSFVALACSVSLSLSFSLSACLLHLLAALSSLPTTHTHLATMIFLSRPALSISSTKASQTGIWCSLARLTQALFTYRLPTPASITRNGKNK